MGELEGVGVCVRRLQCDGSSTARQGQTGVQTGVEPVTECEQLSKQKVPSAKRKNVCV